MEKFMEMSLLLDFYGSLLSERQRSVAEYYYDQDYSLTEAGDLLGISKQAVADSLKRADHSLLQYEEKLGLKARFYHREVEIAKIASELDHITGEIADTQTRSALERLSKRLRALLSDEEIAEGEML